MPNGRDFIDPDRTVLYAWVRRHNGETEIQETVVPKSEPLVSPRLDKIDRSGVHTQLQQIADQHGRSIRLVACLEIDTLKVIQPKRRKRKQGT